MNQAAPAIQTDILERFVPPEVWPLTDHQTDLSRIARDPKLTSAIAARLREIPSTATTPATWRSSLTKVFTSS